MRPQRGGQQLLAMLFRHAAGRAKGRSSHRPLRNLCDTECALRAAFGARSPV